MRTSFTGKIGYGPRNVQTQLFFSTATAVYGTLPGINLGAGLMKFHRNHESLVLSEFDKRFWCLLWQLGLDLIDMFDVVGIDFGCYLGKDPQLGQALFKLCDARDASHIIVAVEDPENQFETTVIKFCPEAYREAVFVTDEEARIKVMILDLSFRVKRNEEVEFSDSPFDREPGPGDLPFYAEYTTNEELLETCGFKE